MLPKQATSPARCGVGWRRSAWASTPLHAHINVNPVKIIGAIGAIGAVVMVDAGKAKSELKLVQK